MVEVSKDFQCIIHDIQDDEVGYDFDFKKMTMMKIKNYDDYDSDNIDNNDGIVDIDNHRKTQLK